MKSQHAAEIRNVTARTGKGRSRGFANAVDLSNAGVDAWRKSMGLPALERKVEIKTSNTFHGWVGYVIEDGSLKATARPDSETRFGFDTEAEAIAAAEKLAK